MPRESSGKPSKKPDKKKDKPKDQKTQEVAGARPPVDVDPGG